MTAWYEKARAGEMLPTCAPLGYQWSELEPDGLKKRGATPRIDESEAALVRMIFDRHPDMTVHGLVRVLNGSGHHLPVKSPKRHEKHGRSHTPIDAKALADILTNEMCTGVVSWGKPPRFRACSPRSSDIEVRSYRSYR